MKKLTLKDLSFLKGEVLSRSQLKRVLGGHIGSASGSGSHSPGSGSMAGYAHCPDSCHDDVGCEGKTCASKEVPGCSNQPLTCQ
jgi:natural product precursor